LKAKRKKCESKLLIIQSFHAPPVGLWGVKCRVEKFFNHLKIASILTFTHIVLLALGRWL